MGEAQDGTARPKQLDVITEIRGLMSTNLEPLLTVDEAAEILRMSASWVMSEIRAGRLKPTKLGRIVRIERADLRTFIDSHKAVAEIVTTLSLPANFDTEGAILKVTEKKRGHEW